MRPPKPDFLVKYEEWRKNGWPRCCHTCWHYDYNGYCEAFKLRPPPQFLESQDNCPVWELDCPF